MGIGPRVKVLRIASIAFAVLGLVSISTTILLLVGDDEIVVGGSVQSFGTAPPNTPFDMNIMLRNTRPWPVSILGAIHGACRLEGCYQVVDLPRVVPPFSTRNVRLRVSTIQDGWFDAPFELFTNRPSQSRIPLRIQGTVAPELSATDGGGIR